MHDAFLLFRAYYRGVKPFSQMLPVKNRVGKIFFTILLLYGFGVLSCMLGLTYRGYAKAGDAYACYFAASLLTFSFLFCFSLFNVQSQYATGMDIPLLLPLPVRKEDLALSRFLISLSGLFPYACFLFVPAIVVQIAIEGVSTYLVVSSILLFFILLSCSYSCAVIVASLFLRLLGRKNGKGVAKIVTMLLIILVAVYGCRMGLSYLEGSLDVASLSGTLGKMEKMFPVFLFFAKVKDNIHILVFALVFALVLPYLSILLVSSFLLRLNEQGSASPAKKERAKETMGKGRTIHRALVVREWDVVKSESAFRMEVVMELLVPILLIVIYALMGILGDMGDALSFLSSYERLGEVVLLAIILFMTMGSISCTSVSREGKRFPMDKDYPLLPWDYLMAKLSFHLLLTLPVGILYFLAATVLFPIPLADLLWMVPLFCLLVTDNSLVGLAIDYLHPHLEWTLPQQAMKSNTNVLLSLLCDIVLVGVLALILLLMPRIISQFVAFSVYALTSFLLGKWALFAATKGLRGN